MKKAIRIKSTLVILLICIYGSGCGLKDTLEQGELLGANTREESEGMFSLVECNKVAEGGTYEIISGFSGEAPVITTMEGTWESTDVLNPSVIRWKDQWYNYYSGWDGDTWRTGVAVSADGINWVKEINNPVLDVRNTGWDSTYIAANGSAVVFSDKIYYFYQGRDDDSKVSAIGLAISEDALSFDVRSDCPVVKAGGGENGIAPELRILM